MKTNRLDSLKDFWDGLAEKFCSYEIPTFENNEFLQLLKREEMLDNNGCALDIGCGGGKYSLALAPYFNKIIGTDISKNMIEGARKKCSEENINNVEFMEVSWEELDAEKLNWENKFDFVFAHMTPAVNEEETINKLRHVAKGWCGVTKSVYRKSEIADKINDICGGIYNDYGENELNNLIAILWADGITPNIFYEHLTWEDTHPKDKTAENYIKRMSIKKELTEKEKSEIIGYCNSIAVNDSITEFTKVIECTVYWKENQEGLK